MAVLKNNKFVLQYWDQLVAIDNESIQVTLDGDRFSHQPDSGASQVDGWYAAYEEGVFVFFKDNLDRILIGWNQSAIDVDLIDRVNWLNSFSGRLFECFDKGNRSLLKANYHSYRRFIFNPLKLFSEFVMPDDNWGLVADLPSFIHSSIEDGSIYTKFDQLQKRDSSKTGSEPNT